MRQHDASLATPAVLDGPLGTLWQTYADETALLNKMMQRDGTEYRCVEQGLVVVRAWTAFRDAVAEKDADDRLSSRMKAQDDRLLKAETAIDQSRYLLHAIFAGGLFDQMPEDESAHADYLAGCAIVEQVYDLLQQAAAA